MTVGAISSPLPSPLLLLFSSFPFPYFPLFSPLSPPQNGSRGNVILSVVYVQYRHLYDGSSMYVFVDLSREKFATFGG